MHVIRGYGDTAVAEHAIALMWAAARDLVAMDRGVRAGELAANEGMQLTGKTIGLLGFGGIAARSGTDRRRVGHAGAGLEPHPRRQRRGSTSSMSETLLAESDVLSLHLLLTEETRGNSVGGADCAGCGQGRSW